MHDWKAASHSAAELNSCHLKEITSVSAPVIGLEINLLLDQVF